MGLHSNIILFSFFIPLLLSCSGKFYSTPHEGNIFIQVKAFASDDGIVRVNDKEVAKIDSEGNVFDNYGRRTGRSQYTLVTKGNIKIRMNAFAREDGSVYSPDTILLGEINKKGRIRDASGKQIGKRKASLEELVEYYEKNRRLYE